MNEPIPFQGGDRSNGAAQFFSRMQRYKTLLKRRWWILLLTLGIAVGAQTFRASKTPLTYVSKAQMIVGNRTPLTESAGAAYDENFVGTTIALLKGNLITSRALDSLKTNYPNLSSGEVVLNADLVPRTSIFLLTARGPSPKLTQAYLNAIMDEFLKYRQEIRGKSSEETMQVVTAEMRKAQQQVAEGYQELEAFRKNYNVASVEQEATSTALRHTALKDELAKLRREFLLLESLNSLPVTAPTAEKNDGGTGLDLREQDTARKQLAVLLDQKNELEKFLKDKHPKMIKLEGEIAAQRKLIEIYQKHSSEQLAKRRTELQKHMATLQSEIDSEFKKSIEASSRFAVYDRIRAKVKEAEGLNERIAKMLEQVKLTKEVPIETISVLEFATVAKADNSGFTKNIVIGCFIGLVFGVGLLFLLDRFDDRPVSFHELQEHFDELILGQIPQDASRSRDRKLLPLTVNDTRYAYAEAHRNLRSSLIFMAIEGARPRTIVITSAVPGEGKSTVAVNLAITMAFSGSRVLLIDADLRKGTVHEYFEMTDQPGLAEVLSGDTAWESVIQQTHVPNLSVMPRGNYPANPGELLLGGADALIKEIYQHFDFILFDSAPVLAADDTASLAPKVDGTLFVIRSGYTSARLGRNALDLLYQRQVNVMGIVFNSVETNSREYYYFKYPEYYSKRIAQKS
jgi:polysaccharide biosynthesis transport protein